MKSPFIKDGYSSRMPATACPTCFMMLDGVTSMEGQEPPKPGDYTICAKCASLLRFDENMQLALASLMDIPVEHRFKFAKGVQAVKQLRGIR